MEKLKKLLKNNIQISILMILLFSLSTVTIGNTQAADLEIEVSTTLLIPEINNNIILTLYNNFEPIYELCVSSSFPTSTQDSSFPTIIGTHSCTFDKLSEGDSVEVPITIFVPEDAAGNAYSLDIVLTYKRLGYLSSFTETYTIGFNVQEKEEWIDLILYDFEVDPDPAQPGASITFSANILNKGNIPSMYTNVSLIKNDILILLPESYSYLGQIDPNSPATFDLEASVKAQTREGRYIVEILVSFEDEDTVPFTVTRQISFNVLELKEERAPPGPLESILGPIRNLLFPQQPQGSPTQPPQGLPILSFIPLIILMVIIIGVVMLVRRRRSRKNEFEEAFEES